MQPLDQSLQQHKTSHQTQTPQLQQKSSLLSSLVATSINVTASSLNTMVSLIPSKTVRSAVLSVSESFLNRINNAPALLPARFDAKSVDDLRQDDGINEDRDEVEDEDGEEDCFIASLQSTLNKRKFSGRVLAQPRGDGTNSGTSPSSSQPVQRPRSIVPSLSGASGINERRSSVPLTHKSVMHIEQQQQQQQRRPSALAPLSTSTITLGGRRRPSFSLSLSPTIITSFTPAPPPALSPTATTLTTLPAPASKLSPSVPSPTSPVLLSYSWYAPSKAFNSPLSPSHVKQTLNYSLYPHSQHYHQQQRNMLMSSTSSSVFPHENYFESQDIPNFPEHDSLKRVPSVSLDASLKRVTSAPILSFR